MLLEEAFEERIYSQQTRQALVLSSGWEDRLKHPVSDTTLFDKVSVKVSDLHGGF